ncbi:MAG: valine--tRNA ligase [Pseudopedobacter saltans]|uniref:Valine--tRNA ligase n=1 Tax=Pseudopedobacter saltans TaxID=151895 RepID=A0A2W5GAR6_9SPHI|nr:MAG: valine--tRNA ligase [Pseudopedobacter saltans]
MAFRSSSRARHCAWFTARLPVFSPIDLENTNIQCSLFEHNANQIARHRSDCFIFFDISEYGGIIYNQIERLGCSVDWNRVSFTMDDHYYKAVIKVFVELYEKGLIYRGARMINWDPVAQTALSDEEVEYKDGQGKLYYVKYTVANGVKSPDGKDYIIIGTQRPETIMGDAAICINPNDPRYTWLKGQKVIVPMVNREIPIIEDEYVDIEFGTGCLKVTPAHDINDYNLGLKHHLPVIDILNADGTISEAAQVFVGMERFAARKAVVAELTSENRLEKEEEYTTRIGYSQRTNAVAEPRISTQWFVKMKDLAAPALDAVVSGKIKIHPGDKFLATYKYWLENVKDWCISRQLWWGQQIPAFYDKDGKLYVAATKEDAQAKAGAGVELTQDEDVLDTWFSSWLWPTEVFQGITHPGNEEIKYYYPTSVLVTGQDIIFFWVARMVMAGLEFEHEIPFNDVYFTGMVRDKLGRKMSKSLGNSPELLGLIDKYGADAVRFGIMIAAPAGNDLLFDEAALEQGRNFNNKMWNALKLLKMWEEKRADIPAETAQEFAINWFENRLNQAKKEIEKLHGEFRLSEALKVLYSLIWDDFCSWYLEWIKPGFETPISNTVLDKTISFFEDLVQLLHPYMPFITEDIFHLLKKQDIDLCVKQFETVSDFDSTILENGELLKKTISAIRDARNKNQIKPKETIKLHIQTSNPATYEAIDAILAKQVNAELIDFQTDNISNAVIVAVEKDQFHMECTTAIDSNKIKEELLKDLEHQENFLQSVQKKLSNERFVQNAKPEVVALEQKKQSDAEARIQTIKESLAGLN